MSITTIDQQIAELFNNNFGLGGDWNWGNLLLCVLAIILSVILCSFIGAEREKRGRSAGLRTHLLVGVGSCILMIVSIYGFPKGSNFDVSRIAAGVVAGVGFLGAGTIIHNEGGIRGLTTASTIWLVMAIGLACGSMNFILAIGTTLVVMLILTIFKKAEKFIAKSNTYMIVVVPASSTITTSLLTLCDKFNYHISDLSTNRVISGGEDCLEVTFKITDNNEKQVNPTQFVADLEKEIPVKAFTVLSHR